MPWADSAAVCTHLVPDAIYNPVAIKLLVSGLLTGHTCYVHLFYIMTDFVFYLISSMYVIHLLF